MSGYSFTSSGNSGDPAVQEAVKAAVDDVLDQARYGVASRDFEGGPKGWHYHASGDTESPEDHRLIADQLGEAISHPGAQTGHSEFSSAHVQRQNYHQPRPAPES